MVKRYHTEDKDLGVAGSIPVWREFALLVCPTIPRRAKLLTRYFMDKDKFEAWLTKLVAYLESQKVSADKIYAVVYEYGHELASEILEQYQTFKGETKNGKNKR